MPSSRSAGTPQGSVLSPLLCNIYLNELDVFMNQLMSKHNTKANRDKNKMWHKVNRLMKKAFNAGDIDLGQKRNCVASYSCCPATTLKIQNTAVFTMSVTGMTLSLVLKALVSLLSM